MQYHSAHDFLDLVTEIPVVDVRSPAEFEKGHITGASNIPIFTNKERAVVGTLYKHEGREKAIDKGLEFVGPRMQEMARMAKELARDGKLAVYCWRGGMRSEKMAMLFEMGGLECHLLQGGYKAFRNQLLGDLSEVEHLIVLSGPTGSGKTDILKELHRLGEQVVDLEHLANHRGSAFGALGMGEQPHTHQFQAEVHHAFKQCDVGKRIWIESESLTIGRVYLPEPLWRVMNTSLVMEVDIDRQVRINRLLDDYGDFPPEKIAYAIQKLQSRFGPQNVKRCLELIDEGNDRAVAESLVAYYDKAYGYSREKYKDGKRHKIALAGDDVNSWARTLVAEADRLHL